jgi:hypothetical protein
MLDLKDVSSVCRVIALFSGDAPEGVKKLVSPFFRPNKNGLLSRL